MSSAATSFRERRALFVALLALLAVNAVILVSYRSFYDERLRALVAEQAGLELRRDRARQAADEALAAERRLLETQETLTAFFSETLGRREERLAPLIEEIYRVTRAAGLRPDAINYSSVDEAGTDALTLGFGVSGPYANVKRLLADLERSPRFLVVERLALAGGGGDDPNAVNISIIVRSYFRPGALRPIRIVRDSANGKAARTRPEPPGRTSP